MSDTVASSSSVEILPSVELLSVRVWQEIVSVSQSSIAHHGRFVLGLSGGSLPKQLAMAPFTTYPIEWDKCYVVFADERCTATLDHEDSNFHGSDVNLFSKLPSLPRDHIFPVDPTLADDPDKMADAYATTIKTVCTPSPAGLPSVDLLLLGIGPDGHTCSLFPHHKLLDEHTRLVAPIYDSKKPPPRRVTLTFPVVNASANAVFVCTGEGKAPVLKEILEGDGDGRNTPAKLVKLTHGKLTWLLDDAAGRLLTSVKKN